MTEGLRSPKDLNIVLEGSTLADATRKRGEMVSFVYSITHNGVGSDEDVGRCFAELEMVGY
jgi:hypothetical protein